MSRFCAKPTCSDVAQRWFDIAAAEREVVERAEPTASSVALCEAHAARFSTPNGWRFTASAPVETEMAVDAPAGVQRPSDPQAPSTFEAALVRDHAPRRARSRQHDRDTPWFLTLSDAPALDVPAGTETVGSEEAEVTSAPDAGSLLHRAFHGPDREIDIARARAAERDRTSQLETPGADDGRDIAELGDLTVRRAERSTAKGGYDIELPFPPLNSAPRTAVS
jgi:hypothetical protein